MVMGHSDGGWGWVVMVAAFVISMIVDGAGYTFGLFFPEFLSHYGESRGKTQLLNSVLIELLFIEGPLAGALVKRYGARREIVMGGIMSSVGIFLSTFSPNLDVMILLYGFLGGTGFALFYLPALVMVSMYFDRRRALATGIAVCGSGVGGLVCAPLYEYLLEIYGWQGTVWIMSAFVLNAVVCGAALDIQLSADDGAFLISIICIANTVARLVTGYISDKPFVDTVLINSTALVIGGLATCFSSYCTTFGMLAAYSALYGPVIGIFIMLKIIILTELLGIRRLASSLGLNLFLQGLGTFLGSPIAGALSDRTGDYVITFYFGGITLGLAGLICFPLRWIARRQEISEANESRTSAPSKESNTFQSNDLRNRKNIAMITGNTVPY